MEINHMWMRVNGVHGTWQIYYYYYYYLSHESRIEEYEPSEKDAGDDMEDLNGRGKVGGE